jgi:hypothetical protein
MNPFMIEDDEDEEDTIQNSVSDEVEVELYGKVGVDPHLFVSCHVVIKI